MIKHLKRILLSIALCAYSLSMAQQVDSLVIHGQVSDQYGSPLPVVIIEQDYGNNFVFTDADGKFELKLIPQRRYQVKASLVGYQSITLVLDNSDTIPLFVTLPPIVKEEEQVKETKPKRLSMLGVYVDYTFVDPNFSRFTDLQPFQINQLNRVEHFIGFGIQWYIANIYADFGFAFTPTLKERTSEYRHYTEGKFFRFNVGYGFSWFDQSLILTPYLGINLLGVNEYITPLDKKISLDQYLEKGYMDIFFTQYMGSVGAKLDYRVLSFGRRQSLYVSASAMLLGQLTRHPKITSKGTTITSPNRMSTFPLGCSVSIRYMFYTRQ